MRIFTTTNTNFRDGTEPPQCLHCLSAHHSTPHIHTRASQPAQAAASLLRFTVSALSSEPLLGKMDVKFTKFHALLTHTLAQFLTSALRS